MHDELSHVGIKGMQWGVRKGRASSATKKPVNTSADHKTKIKLKKKKVSEMSNDELKTLTSRLQLEKQYKDLRKGTASPGQKFVSDVLSNAGKQAVTAYAAKQAASTIEKIFTKKA